MSHNIGRAQINISHSTPYEDYPFLNACHMQLNPWQAATPSEDFRLLFNSRGYPTRMCAGGNWGSSQLWIYGRAGDVWHLEWSGSATLTLAAAFDGGGLSAETISANHKKYTITGSPTALALLVSLTISAMADNNWDAGGSYIRLYRDEHSALVASGEIFHPDFLERMAHWGCIRFLDWMLMEFGNDNNETEWDKRKVLGDYSYFGRKYLSDKWCSGNGTNGGATGVNDYVVNQPSDTITTWEEGRIVQFLMETKPVFRTISACTNANPGVATSVGHGYVDGDIIEFEPVYSGTAWGLLTEANLNLKQTYTVTRVDDDNFSFGVNTSAFGAYPGGMDVYKQVTLKVGSLDPIPLLYIKYASAFSSSTFPNNATITGVYDAVIGRLMVAEVNLSAGGSSMGFYLSSVPVEVMVALCNRVGAHPWFTFPFYASDDYITQFATYVRDNLDSGLIPRFEWLNEVWNFWGTYTANMRAFLDPVLNGRNYQLYYGKRISQISDLISAVYSGSGKDHKIIMAVWGVGGMNSQVTTNRFQCPPISNGNAALYPINKCHAIAYNGYWTAPFFYHSSNAASFPGYINAVYDYLQGDIDAAFDWVSDWCISSRAHATARANSTAYALDDIIYTAGNSTCIFYCTTAGTSAGSLPAGYAAIIDTNGATVNDGTAVFTSWAEQQSIDYNINVLAAFWKAQADLYGKELTEYEAGINIAGYQYVLGGFPAEHAPSQTTITEDNVRAFWMAFLRSEQYRALVIKHADDFVAAGGVFPSQYHVAGPVSDAVYWGLFLFDEQFTGNPQPEAFAYFQAWSHHKRRMRLIAS